MVTEAQIDNLVETVDTRTQEMLTALQALRHVQLKRPQGQPSFIPQNNFKFREFTQAERDTVFADAVAELQRIKALL